MISIIIPTYNRASTILDSINSVLNQSYADFELIVVDDGSTDKTREILEQIEDPRVHYYYQKNSGACSARNKGIKLSKGDYIAFHDSDDEWYPDKLQKQIDYILETDVDIVFCKMTFIKENGEKEILPHNINGGVITLNDDLFGIGTQTLLGKAEVFKDCNFDVSLPRLQDFELVYRLLQRYKIACLDEPLVHYSLSYDSISKSDEKLIIAFETILGKYSHIQSESPQLCKKIATILLVCASRKRKNKDKNYKRVIRIALMYNSSLKTVLKALLIELGLYYRD